MTTALPRSEIETEPETGSRDPDTRRSVLIALAIVALMALSLVAHLGALHRDLPIPDTDEQDFVQPAVHIAATGDLNPHWFGHPGSTVIYPIAALVHVWDATLHDGPILGSNGALEARYHRTPAPFYLIGRIWTIALGIAAIPVIYLLGSRAFRRRVGFIGAVLWAVLPYPIQADRIVRTESAAVFFGMLALYCCVRVWQEPRRRWWLAAGAATGVAISTRWFMVALVPCLLAAVVVPAWGNRRRWLVASVSAGAATVVAFLVTTPALLFDLSQARRDLGAEANVTHTVADGLSRPGNARWYLGTAVPATMTWAIYLLAVVGIVFVLRRRVPYQLMLVAFAVIFLIGISVSSLHWQRWSIELVPVLSLFAALAVVEIAGWISTRLGAPRAGLVVAGIATLALVVVPVLDLVDVNRVDSEASSRVVARRWVQQHVPSGSRVVQLPRVFNLHPDAAPPIGHGIRISYDLDPSRPLSWYRARGVDYVVVGRGDAYNAMLRGARHSGGSGFFGQLACTTRLVANLKGHDTVDDLGVSVYRLDRKPVRLLNFLCLQPDPGSR